MCRSTESMLFWNAFSLAFIIIFFQPVSCYKGCESGSVRPEPGLESLNPGALQSTQRAIHLLIWASKRAFCMEERGRGKEGEGWGKKCCRVIFRLNVPLHNNLHKQPCVCDKKIGNFQRLCGDWELKAFLCYLPSCSWPPQIPQLLSHTFPTKLRLINFLGSFSLLALTVLSRSLSPTRLHSLLTVALASSCNSNAVILGKDEGNK